LQSLKKTDEFTMAGQVVLSTKHFANLSSPL